MDRKFVIALSSLAGSMMLTEAHAIGLGEIKLRSALNEPLRADIQLVQVNDLSENEILVNLAPPADFARAKVDRDFLLNSLRFRLDLDDPKKPRIVVTTQQPIREPFLNFLVEVQWPSGRLLREYTVLMDLPAFADSPSSSGIRSAVAPGKPVPRDEGVAEVVNEPAPVRAPAPKVSAPAVQPERVKVRRATPEEIRQARADEQPPAVMEESAPAVQENQPEPVAEPAPTQQQEGDNTYGPTSASDTLWSIAKGVRNGGSVHQNLVAIQRLNPDAFANGNINLLKKGQVLKLPSQEEIASIGRAEAIAEVSKQNDDWKSRKSATAAPAAGAQLDATGRPQEAAPADAAADGQLKLATPADGSSAQAGQGSGEPGAEVSALKNELAVGMEELDRAQREKDEMASRVQDLDGQIQSAEKLLELQSSEMAAMQAKLEAEQKAKAEAEAAAAAALAAADAQAKVDAEIQAKAAAEAQAKAEAEAAAQAAAESQAKAEAAAQAVAETQPKTEAEPAVQPGEVSPDTAPSEQAQQAPAVESSAPEVVDTAAAPEPAAPAQEALPVQPESVAQAPAPVVEQPVPAVKKPVPAQVEAPKSIMDSLLNTQVLAGIAAIVLALIGLFAYRRKTAKDSEAAADSYAEDQAVEYTPAERAEEDFSGQAATFEQPEQHDEFADLELDLEPEQEPVSAQAPSEVEVPAVEHKAETGDVLGEADIYISFGNFDKGESLLKSAISSEPGRADLRLKLLELYKESDNLSGFDGAYKDLIELDDDFAIAKAAEMRGRISGADATPFAFGVSSAAAAAGISDEIELDFDLDTDFVEEVEAAPVVEQSVESGGAAGNEFDLDFDLESTPAAESATDEFLLDLDTDFAGNLEEEAAAETAEFVSEAEGFDLDFDLDTEVPAVNSTQLRESVSVEEEPPVTVSTLSEPESAMLEAVTADAGEIDEELDFLSDADESATKLDLARAYIDMGDKDGAKDILAEVLEEGREEQKREAQALLDSIGG